MKGTNGEQSVNRRKTTKKAQETTTERVNKTRETPIAYYLPTHRHVAKVFQKMSNFRHG